MDANHKLEREKNILKEQVINLQSSMQRRKQELVTLKQELEQAKVVEEKYIGTRIINKESQMKDL